MSQWDYKIDQPMPGPFPFPNSRKGPGIEVGNRCTYIPQNEVSVQTWTNNLRISDIISLFCNSFIEF